MATEKRLIRYDDVYQYAMDGFYGGGLENEDFDAIINAIDSVLAVDAVEVVHGQWDYQPETLHTKAGYRCTVCQGALWHSSDVPQAFKYCPECGAKMDGGADT